jgi:hypothetical protein
MSLKRRIEKLEAVTATGPSPNSDALAAVFREHPQLGACMGMLLLSSPSGLTVREAIEYHRAAGTKGIEL